MRRKVGTIEWNKDGSCRISVTRGRMSNGKKRRITVRLRDATPEEAELKVYQLAKELGASDLLDDSMSLRSYFYSVFCNSPSVRGTPRSKATIDFYRQALERDAFPRLGSEPVSRISHTQLVETIKSAHSQRNCKVALRAVMLSAFDDGLLPEKPFQRRIAVQRTKRPPVQPWTLEEASEALRAFRSAPPDLEAWLILGLSGLRKGECLGARPMDIEEMDTIDPETGETLHSMVVHVRRTFSDRNGEVDAVKNEWAVRTVPIIYQGRERLREIMANCEPDARLTGDYRDDTLGKMWRATLKELGLRYIPPKALRHTSDTIALNSGINLDLNDKMHGRREHATTYRHYYNPDLGAMEKAARKVSYSSGR